MKFKALILSLAFLLNVFCLPLQQSFAQVNSDLLDSQVYLEKTIKHPLMNDHSREITELLKKMTLEEKVGQMTDLTLATIVSDYHQDVKVDPAKIEKAVIKYGIGSFQNVNEQALTIDKWHEIIGAIKVANAKTRLKIPVIYGIDTIHSANSVTLSIAIKTSGLRAGKETAILYLRDEVASLSPPGKRVKRFAKILLTAGESKTLTFKLNRDDLSFIGSGNKPIAEPGDFAVIIGGLSAKFTLK